MPVQKIKSFVLGGHGDTMVAMLGSTKVEGKNILDLVSMSTNTSSSPITIAVFGVMNFLGICLPLPN